MIRFALQWGFLDEELHGRKLMKFFFEEERRDKALFIPRGHVKTMFSVARLVQYTLRHPNSAVIAGSATEDFAKQIGRLYSDILLNNDILRQAFPDIVPQSKVDLRLWGLKGYELPSRTPRLDPTFFSASVGTNVTGRHPDLIYLDDLIVPGNNNPDGWAKGKEFLKTCKALLPPHGWLELVGTRYHDGDFYSEIISGEILGNQGPFHTMVESCYVDDDPNKGVIYPEKNRWNMDTPSGYSMELLRRKQRDLGRFFNAQYRNNPAPDEEQIIQVKMLNFFDAKDLPKFSQCSAVGIEVTGGGLPIYNVLKEEVEKLNIWMPLVEITNPNKQGVDKEIRIVTALEKIVREGRLHLAPWMRGEGSEDTESLFYELKRLGVAKHDDIADALHNIPVNLCKGTLPLEGQPADFYISVDLSYSEKQKSDFTVILACAVDAKGNYYVFDYERFKLSSPVGIAHRIIQFYQKHNANADSIVGRKRRNFISSYN